MRNTATHFKLQRRRMTGFFACALTFISIASATAQPINVPSFSFETPIAPVDSGNPNFDNWQENPEPPGFDPGGGLDWSFRAGVFRAPAIVPDGDQAAYLFNTPGIGIYQQLTETYQPGLSYDLIVGVHPGITRPPTAGDQLRISLSYDNAGTLVPFSPLRSYSTPEISRILSPSMITASAFPMSRTRMPGAVRTLWSSLKPCPAMGAEPGTWTTFV